MAVHEGLSVCMSSWTTVLGRLARAVSADVDGSHGPGGGYVSLARPHRDTGSVVVHLGPTQPST